MVMLEDLVEEVLDIQAPVNQLLVVRPVLLVKEM
jgi:hypothetical protein